MLGRGKEQLTIRGKAEDIKKLLGAPVEPTVGGTVPVPPVTELEQSQVNSIKKAMEDNRIPVIDRTARSRARNAMAIGITGAVIAATSLGLGLGLRGCDNRADVRYGDGRPGITEMTLPATPTTSEAAGQPDPSTATTVFEANNTTAPTTEASASVPLVKVENVQEAAQTFGADAYSKNPANWEINNYGGAHLFDNKTGNANRVNTAGATWEGWLKFPMVDGGIDAMTLVVDANVPQVDLQGGTAWKLSDPEAGFAQLLGQVRPKEAKEQPGVLVIPVCADLQPLTTESEPLNKIASAKDAAARFGADSYSNNPANWEINEWGGAHLKDNPTGKASLVKTAGATLEGWDKIHRDGITAITFVVHANVPEMRIHGGTFWDFPNQDRGFEQLLGQVERKEAKEQPGVLVLPVYDCTLAQK